MSNKKFLAANWDAANISPPWLVRNGISLAVITIALAVIISATIPYPASEDMVVMNVDSKLPDSAYEIQLKSTDTTLLLLKLRGVVKIRFKNKANRFGVVDDLAEATILNKDVRLRRLTVKCQYSGKLAHPKKMDTVTVIIREGTFLTHIWIGVTKRQRKQIIPSFITTLIPPNLCFSIFNLKNCHHEKGKSGWKCPFQRCSTEDFRW